MANLRNSKLNWFVNPSIWLIWVFSLTFLSACKKETGGVSTPVLQISEVALGSANDKVGYAGQDFHIAAVLEASEPIKELKLQITPARSGAGWIFEQRYSDQIESLRKAVFHEHLNVPSTALAGDYDLLMVLTDQDGHKTEYSATIKIIKDQTLPSATGMQVMLDSESILNVSGKLKVPNKLETIIIEVQSTAWTRNFSFVDAKGAVDIDFKTAIDLTAAPKGHYHVNLTLIDQTNKRMALSYHFDK